MGDVICVYKLIPSSAEDLISVKAELLKLQPAKIEEEPLAFGLNLLKATFIVPEKDGALDELENKLNSIKFVESVELAGMTRSL